MSGQNSNPGFTIGTVPTASQWNGYFTNKIDATNGYATNLALTGGTINGVPVANIVSGLGEAQSGNLLANITSAPAYATFVSATQFLDYVLGSTIGGIAYRSTTGWAALAAGVSGYVLQTNGALQNPTWEPITSVLGYTPANRAGDTFSGLVGFTLAATVTAAGSGQSNATPLTHQINIITTATIGAGVIHAAATGIEIKTMNRSGVSVLIYPPVGVQWEGYGANTPISLPSGNVLHTVVVSTSQGYVS